MSKSKFLTLFYNVYFIRKFLLDIRKNIRNLPVSIQDVYRQYVYISWTKTSNFPVASFFFLVFFLRRIRIYLWPHCPPKNLITFVNAIDLKHFVFFYTISQGTVIQVTTWKKNVIQRKPILIQFDKNWLLCPFCTWHKTKQQYIFIYLSMYI